MTKTLIAVLVILFSFNAHSNNLESQRADDACFNKKTFLRDICKVQELIDTTAHFKACANGYSYYISTDISEANPNLMGNKVSCKMVELRNDKSINKRITYFDEYSNKVVVYEHINGLSNTFVYGHTGYYHISELSSGDSLYNFYSFEN